MVYLPPVRKLANPPTDVDLWVDAFCTRLAELYPHIDGERLVVTCADIFERYKLCPRYMLPNAMQRKKVHRLRMLTDGSGAR